MPLFLIVVAGVGLGIYFGLSYRHHSSFSETFGAVIAECREHAAFDKSPEGKPPNRIGTKLIVCTKDGKDVAYSEGLQIDRVRARTPEEVKSVVFVKTMRTEGSTYFNTKTGLTGTVYHTSFAVCVVDRGTRKSVALDVVADPSDEYARAKLKGRHVLDLWIAERTGIDDVAVVKRGFFRGLAHGFTYPLRLMGAFGLRFAESAARTIRYWVGTILAGFVTTLVLYVLAANLGYAIWRGLRPARSEGG